MVSVPIALHTGLHEIRDLVSVVVVTVFFCNWKTILLCVELLQNIIPYFVSEWKLAKYIILSVLQWIHKSDCIRGTAHSW